MGGHEERYRTGELKKRELEDFCKTLGPPIFISELLTFDRTFWSEKVLFLSIWVIFVHCRVILKSQF